MKYILIIFFLLAAIMGRTQTITTNKIQFKILNEDFTIAQKYEIKRAGNTVYFEKPISHGSEGWAFNIIDSTKKGVYILDYHWMSTFDSLEIKPTYVRLFNHTMDAVIYSK